MPNVQLNDGRVSLADGRIVLAIAGDPCCCGPAAAEGYYGATPCSNVCDPSIAPPVLYIPASVAAGLAGPVFGTLAGCYQIDYSVLYWDCVFRGPPPPFGVGTPPYVCAPLDFYRPGRRYTIDRPPLRAFSGCASCFESLYDRGSAGPAACPGENTLVELSKCPGCFEQAITTAVPPPAYEGELDTRVGGDTFLAPWINIRQVLQDALDGDDGCKAVSVELPSGGVVCLSVDVRFMSTRLEEWDGVSPRIEFVAEHDSCCACHAAISIPDVVGGSECLIGGTVDFPDPPSRFARPRCAPGVRPDWSLAYRCPPEVPIGKPCCCPGTPCHRRLRMRARRVDTRISTGETTVQVWAGWAPGLVRLHALYEGDTVWTPLPGTPFPSHPACDPMSLFQLLGRAGFCGDAGYEVELAAGDCWRASYIESRTDTAGDLYTRIEYYAAFDTLGDEFPFLPELDGVPSGIQSTAGLLGVPVLGVPSGESECEGISQLRRTGVGELVEEAGVVDGDVAASWLVCQDGCSGGGGTFPEPGGPGGLPGLLRTGAGAAGSGGRGGGSGGGCGGCGGEGGL